MKLTMHKEGQFTVLPSNQTAFQCVGSGTQIYRYYIEFEANREDINPETGFLIDVRDVDMYFSKFSVPGNQFRSCENEACTAVDFFVDYLRRNRVRPLRILVRIHGAAGGFMDAEWTQSGKSGRTVSDLRLPQASFIT